jgi:hypothetical protein
MTSNLLRVAFVMGNLSLAACNSSDSTINVNSSPPETRSEALARLALAQVQESLRRESVGDSCRPDDVLLTAEKSLIPLILEFQPTDIRNVSTEYGYVNILARSNHAAEGVHINVLMLGNRCVAFHAYPDWPPTD